MDKAKGKAKPTLTSASRRLARKVDQLTFGGAVAYIYNPLNYAREVHEQYLTRFGSGTKRVVLLGMNPGPFGMMQTGVPFGEVAAVRDWMGLRGQVKEPKHWHPKRRIEGLACERSEVSGRRLWGWAADQFGSAREFFAHSFVINYCPLVFLEESGRNLTPDKLPMTELAPLQAACDAHLKAVIELLKPQWAIGVGAYAAKRLQTVTGVAIETGKQAPNKAVPEKSKRAKAQGAPNGQDRQSGQLRVGQILHPSPASPLANRGWAQAAQASLDSLGVYEPASGN